MSKKHVKTTEVSRRLAKSSIVGSLLNVGTAASGRLNEYLSRRPHRSFRRTRQRDYHRSLDLPGYWAFSAYVFGMIRRNSRLFAGLFVFYAVMAAVLVGLSSQDTYSQLSNLLDETGGGFFEGGWGSLGQAGLLLLTGLSGSLSPQLTDAQQIFSVLISLLTWLTTVWLLRSILAGNKPRLRDGLYNAGSPIVATAIVFLVLLIQLLPATFAVIIVTSAMSTNLFEIGFMAMVICLVAALLFVLSVYWAVASILALIIVTLPGMYPWQAIRTAGDLAVGRRVRILFRTLWMMLVAFVVWVAIVLPTILLARRLSSTWSFFNTVPIVPVMIALVSSMIIIWSAAYMYLLYRKIVEDDAKPA